METAQAARVAAFKPGLTAADGEAASAALAGGWAGSGIYVRMFERRLAGLLRRPFALATNSGTAALHLALRALEVEGGEVITTPLTSVATSHAILYAGAVPVFCDVEADTGNIDPRRVAEAITPRTRAVLAVHFNGHACDMDALRAVARARRAPLVEDAGAALPLGGAYRGRPLGTLGDFGCFSFGRKNFTTLDGGALVHKRARDAARLGRLRNLGQGESGSGERSRVLAELGFPYRMNDLAAAIGLAQFQRWEATAARLASLERLYRAALADCPGVEPPARKAYARRAPSCFPVRARAGKRALRGFLRARGILTDDWLQPNHLLPLYKPHRRRLPVAERVAGELVYLPFYPALRDDEAQRVVEAVLAFGRSRHAR